MKIQLRTDRYGWAAMAAFFGLCCLTLGALMIAGSDDAAGAILVVGGLGGMALCSLEASAVALERRQKREQQQ